MLEVVRLVLIKEEFRNKWKREEIQDYTFAKCAMEIVELLIRERLKSELMENIAYHNNRLVLEKEDHL